MTHATCPLSKRSKEGISAFWRSGTVTAKKGKMLPAFCYDAAGLKMRTPDPPSGHGNKVDHQEHRDQLPHCEAATVRT